MAKRKTRSKRSSGNLPKGLPVGNSSINPFEVSHQSKRQKHDVHNRLPYKTSSPSKLADAVHRRRAAVKAAMSRKANTFEDKRLGEYDPLVSAQEKNLARLVRERSRRSARVEKYSLESSNEELTHGGKSIDKLSAADHVILSDDEEDYGNLDTSMHFGGGTQRNNANNTYGPAGAAAMDLKQVYADRKTDLDELILRRKVNKLERLKTKEEQEEAIEKMDETFDEFSEFLQFRDKESELCAHALQKRHGTLSAEDQEYADWDKEMKQYQFLERKVKATDRTKTAEEIARQAADQLHELETRRLARMNDDFENDALDDISDEEGCRVFKQMKRSKQQQRNHAEALDNDDDSENEGADDKPNVCFTADGLVEIDSHGNILRKVGQPAVADEVETDNDQPVYEVGDRVTACYHASERLDGQELWREGVITSVHKRNDQGTCYDIDYDDGDFEETVEPLSILPQGSEVPNVLTKDKALVDDQALKMKRNKAKVKARYVCAFVTNTRCCWNSWCFLMLSRLSFYNFICTDWKGAFCS
jgi:nucleolar protein 14